MKPTFALNLSNERVALLHRTGRGWLQVGDVAFDTPDLSEALDYLRKTALGLSPRGVTTKLVIPNSEILYCDVEAPGPDDDTRRTQIRAGLAGRTPYAPEDLVFDWRGKGTMVKVAVVARQTLAEAEAFAVEHRFGPVSFVALPEGPHFKGEPYFGQTEAAKTILTKGETVEPDRDTMTILTRDLPIADVADEVEDRPAKRSERSEKYSSDPIADAVEKLRAASQAEIVVPKTEPELEPAISDAVTTSAEPATTSFAEAITNAVPSAKVSEADATHVGDKPASIATPIIDEAPFAEVIDTPPATDNAQAEVLDDIPPAPSPAAQMAFASRRGPDEFAREKAFGDLPGAARADSTTKRSSPPLRSDAQVTAPSIPGSKKRKAGSSTPPPAVAAAAAALATSGAAMGKPTKPLTRPGGTFGAKPLPQRGKPRYLGLILTGLLLVALALIAAWSSYSLVQTDASATGDTSALAPTEAPATAAPTVDDEILADQQDTGASSDPVEALAASEIAPDDSADESTAPASDAMASAEDEAAADGEAAVVAVEPDAVANPALSAETDDATVPAVPASDQDLTVAGSEATPAPAAPAETAEVAAPDVGTAPTEAAEAATPAPEPATPAPDLGLATNATGPEPRASDVPADEIFLATADTAPSFQGALKLPDPAFPPDPLPAAAPPPPPFGTVYQFDSAGLIVPTPEGIMSPEGFMLFAGTPPLKPPARSAVAVAAAATIAPPVVDAVADTQAEGIAATAAASLAAPLVPPEVAPTADPALAGFRPRPRPPGLEVPAAAESADDASLAPAADARFANQRPRARPETVVLAGSTASSEAAAPRARPETLVAGSNARDETAAASLTAQANAAVLAAVASAAETGNVMTLAVSRRPAARPQDMSRAVNAAVAAAVRAPEPEPEVADNSAAVPEDDAEPEVASAAPRIPTKTTVAKQATFANAINLSKVNLIGVYGSPSKRYALIRLASGRYKKVSVGDSFDGGRVEAITASEVRYQKGGRLVSLKMPRA